MYPYEHADYINTLDTLTYKPPVQQDSSVQYHQHVDEQDEQARVKDRMARESLASELEAKNKLYQAHIRMQVQLQLQMQLQMQMQNQLYQQQPQQTNYYTQQHAHQQVYTQQMYQVQQQQHQQQQYQKHIQQQMHQVQLAEARIRNKEKLSKALQLPYGWQFDPNVPLVFFLFFFPSFSFSFFYSPLSFFVCT